MRDADCALQARFRVTRSSCSMRSSIIPTGTVVAVSPTQPSCTTPMSSFTISPYWIRRWLPMPCTISSLSEMQMLPGKNAMPEPIAEKRALHAGLLHEIGRGLVDFLRRNPGPNEFAHAIENIARRAAGQPHFFDFPSVLDRDHAALLSSIKSRNIRENRFAIAIAIDPMQDRALFIKRSPSGCVFVLNSCSRFCKTDSHHRCDANNGPSQ